MTTVMAGGTKPSRSFVLALDARWGQGKTYFVKNWALDLQHSPVPYPTVYFDAWAADYGSDPVTACMSAVKGALEAEIRRTGWTTAAKAAAVAKVHGAVRGLRRALIPAGKEVLKGLVQKATGVAIDGVMEAYADGSVSDAQFDSDALADKSLEEVNKGLDALFSKALEDQAEKGALLDAFRLSVAQTLEHLANEGKRRLPLFVFIDELDRCRPDFAVSLLEGLKHVFGINGVCFVVSTNRAQLTETIKAVYGAGFDGYSYLKRFFDAEFELPAVTDTAFLSMLLGSSPALAAKDLALGLPHQTGIADIVPSNEASTVLRWVASAFELSLRDQMQVLELIRAASAGATGKKIYLLWIAILCAWRHRDPASFERISSSNLDAAGFQREFMIVAKNDVPRSWMDPRSGPRMRGEEPQLQSIQLYAVAWKYYVAARTDLRQIMRDLLGSSLNIYDYPRNVLSDVVEELPSPQVSGRAYPSSICNYFSLVRHAGYLISAV